MLASLQESYLDADAQKKLGQLNRHGSGTQNNDRLRSLSHLQNVITIDETGFLEARNWVVCNHGTRS